MLKARWRKNREQLSLSKAAKAWRRVAEAERQHRTILCGEQRAAGCVSSACLPTALFISSAKFNARKRTLHLISQLAAMPKSEFPPRSHSLTTVEIEISGHFLPRRQLSVMGCFGALSHAPLLESRAVPLLQLHSRAAFNSEQAKAVNADLQSCLP